MAITTGAEPVVSSAPAPSIGRSILPLLVIAISIGTGFAMMQSFGIMAENAKRELRLSDSGLGLVQAGGAAVPLLLFAIPIGILVDRASRVRIMILMGLAWTAGTFLTAMAKGPGILLLARMLTGIGTTGALTAALSLASDLSLPGQRGRAVLIATLGKTAGVAAGSLAAGMLLGMFAAPRAPLWFGEIAPWRSAQWTLGLASLVLIAPLLVLREPSRHEVESGPDAPLRVVLRELLRRRGFLVPLFVGQTSVLMADAAAAIWAAPILERKFELQPAVLAGWLGAIVLVTGIVASIFGGVIADWGQKTGYRGGLLIGAVVAALIGVPAALFPVMAGVPAFAVMFAVLIFAGAITGLITSAALTVFLPNELRGLSISAFIAVAALIGFGVAPPIVIQMSLILGGAQHLATALAIFGVTAGILSVIGFGLAMRRAPLAPTPQTGMRTAVR